MSFVSGATAGSLLGPLLIGGGSLASGILGYNAAQNASNAQVSAEQQALQLQQSQLAKLNPFITEGTNALQTISKMYGSTPNFAQFTNSPDYQFALQQGNLGVQRYENANGLALSGGALKDVSQFNQGLASQQFGNYFNRLMSLSQLGSNAAQAGVGGGNAAAGTIGQIGQSTASGIIGGTNAITGGINSAMTNSLLYNAINRNTTATANPSGYTNTPNYAAPQTNWNGMNAPIPNLPGYPTG